MRLRFIRYSCVSMLLVSALGLGIRTDDHNAQVVLITAKKYAFSPSQVHVKLGMKVQLMITAIDRDHGFTIVRDPVGDDSSLHPLVLTSPAGIDA